jgi:FtsH-binding integral membrane protein
MRLGSLVCGLLTSIIYLMDFLYLQRGLESKLCREILYIMVHAYNACAVLCLLYVNRLEKSPSPPPLHATGNSTFTFTFTLYFKYFLRILCTFYLSTFCLQYFLLLLKSFYC